MLLALVVACGTQAGLAAHDAYTWETPAPGETVAIYMELENGEATDEKVISAISDACSTIELHEASMNDATFRMQPVTEILVPAGDSLRLEPDGYHLMCIGTRRSLEAGDEIEVTLGFPFRLPLFVDVEVVER